MKTKVIATIGQKSDDELVLSKMVQAGMDVARMNFSHCTYDEYRRRVEIIKREAAKCGREVAILQDLQGPRIRVGKMPEDGRMLTRGELISFTVKGEEEGKIFIDEPSLIDSIEVGHPIFLASGEMELIVKSKSTDTFEAEVTRGGTLFSRKGVNVPETQLNFSGYTQKDLDDMKFALAEGVDYIAVSFVQTGDDIRKIKELVDGKARIIAKIETSQALRNIDDIIRESDSIMVARGDLGVEIPMDRWRKFLLYRKI
jgi:pyruvate kinase